MAEHKLRVLELFSGIGGWANALCCLEAEGIFSEVVGAIDINDTANLAYDHLHLKKPLSISLETIPITRLQSFNAQLWVMSPPCQPFTRQHGPTTKDLRTNALYHLVEAIQGLPSPPKYIVLENVIGFESSHECLAFLEALVISGYSFEQFILSPTQFGIPNERPRYFCLATRFARKESTTQLGLEILTSLPGCIDKAPNQIFNYLDDGRSAFTIEEGLLVPDIILNKPASWCFDIVSADDVTSSCFTKAYSRYIKGTGSVLIINPDSDNKHTLVPTVTVDSHDDDEEDEDGAGAIKTKKSRYGTEDPNTSPAALICSHNDHDNVTAMSPVVEGKFLAHINSERECVISSGDQSSTDLQSYLGQSSTLSGGSGSSGQLPAEFHNSPVHRTFDENWKTKLGGRRLRYFSHTELARLFGFTIPEDRPFFPPSISQRKGYELIGNSLNVVVATHLLRYLLRSELALSSQASSSPS